MINKNKIKTEIVKHHRLCNKPFSSSISYMYRGLDEQSVRQLQLHCGSQSSAADFE